MIYGRGQTGQRWAKLSLLQLVIAVQVGCDNDDKRLVEFAREADARQADQNREIAQQNHDLADATNKLIQADAEARKELIAMEHDVQSERAEVGHQRDELEIERREIAHERCFDSATGEALRGGTVLLACLLPLLLCGYMLHALGCVDSDDTVGEILTAEIVSEDPTFLPRSGSSAGEISGRSDHKDAAEDSSA